MTRLVLAVVVAVGVVVFVRRWWRPSGTPAIVVPFPSPRSVP